jgi:hypothetical protein
MAARRVIKSVLWNFLGTYVSRYSDYGGFWLFGFLTDIDELRFNVLGPTASDPDSPMGVATQLATEKFKQQCEKAGIAPSQICESWLAISKLPGAVRGPVNGRPSDGYNIKFTAEAVTDLGRRYKKERTVFVAPHNAAIEIRSARTQISD